MEQVLGCVSCQAGAGRQSSIGKHVLCSGKTQKGEGAGLTRVAAFTASAAAGGVGSSASVLHHTSLYPVSAVDTAGT